MTDKASKLQTKFDYINKNLSRIKEEVRIGIIPCTIINHFEVYSRYYHYRTRGYNVRDSAFYAGMDYNLKERMVFRIIKEMGVTI